MSEVSGGNGWWLASDGRWYPPELAVPPVVQPAASLPPLVVPSPAQQLAAHGTSFLPGQTPAAPPYPGPAPAGAGYPAPYPAPYPYPYGLGAGLPMAKTSPMAIWALVLVIAFGALGALVGIPLAFVARSKIRASGGALKGAGLALAAQIVGFVWVGFLLLAIAIPTFLGVTRSGPSVQNLDFNVRSQITGTAPNDFGATGVGDVACQRPDRWTTGATFSCVAYGPTGAVVGRYVGTVAPNASDGTYSWNGRYVPSY